MFANDLNGPADADSGTRSAYINDAYTILDVRTSFNRELERWDAELFVGIDNLFDSDYNGSVVPNAFGSRFFEPAPGRTYLTGLRLRR